MYNIYIRIKFVQSYVIFCLVRKKSRKKDALS